MNWLFVIITDFNLLGSKWMFSFWKVKIHSYSTWSVKLKWSCLFADRVCLWKVSVQFLWTKTCEVQWIWVDLIPHGIARAQTGLSENISLSWNLGRKRKKHLRKSLCPYKSPRIVKATWYLPERSTHLNRGAVVPRESRTSPERFAPQ